LFAQKFHDVVADREEASQNLVGGDHAYKVYITKAFNNVD
jgi:hypothetical protein